MIHLLSCFIAVPLGCSFIIYLFFRNRDRVADWIANICTLYLLFSSVLMIKVLATERTLTYDMGGWPAPIGINLVLDGFSLVLLLIINLIGFLSTFYSINYIERFTAKAKYYVMFLLMVAGMNGTVLTGDLFNLYVFLEIAAIASYALVAFGCEHEELEASFKYMVMGTISSSFILVGIALIYAMTGTLNMAHFASILAEGNKHHGFLISLAFLLMGFSLKAALVPFHAWLPDAHPSAPAPISAMLSGVLIKAIGIYCILRFSFNLFGITPASSLILIILGAVSMVIGVFLAIGQWDYKRLLAYHSISQMGYVILGAGVGGAVIASGGSDVMASMGIMGGLFHLINHAIFKSLLFLTSGAVEYSTGTRNLKKMGGLTAKMPATGVTATIAALSIGGVPPFNGFFSKLFIILASHHAKYYFLSLISLVVSVMTLASFLKVQKYAFFGKLKDELQTVKEVPRLMCTSMIILSIMCLLTALLCFSPIRELLLEPAVKTLTQGLEYRNIIQGAINVE